jgi:lysophospholipase L1-like esterase
MLSGIKKINDSYHRFSKTKIVLYSGITLLITAFLCLGLSEVLLRIFAQVPTKIVHTASKETFNRILGAFEPGQNVYEESHPKLGYHVYINALGYRGPEIRIQKKPGVARIVCIGDSLTYGQFVSEDGIFSAHLQRLFISHEIPVEVINAGVPGTTIVDQLFYLTRSMVLQPDLVILTFSENDIDDMGKPPMYQMLERNRELKSAPILGLLHRTIRDTAVFNFVLHVNNTGKFFSLGRDNAAASIESIHDTNRKDINDSLWKRYEQYLGQFAYKLKSQRIGFIFTLFPHYQRLNGSRDLTDSVRDRLSKVESLASNLGIKTINVLPELMKSGMRQEELYLFPYDGHPSSSGYKVQADVVFQHIKEDIRQRLRNY